MEGRNRSLRSRIGDELALATPAHVRPSRESCSVRFVSRSRWRHDLLARRGTGSLRPPRLMLLKKVHHASLVSDRCDQRRSVLDTGFHGDVGV